MKIKSLIACFHVTSRHCVAMARNGDGGQEVIFYIGHFRMFVNNRHRDTSGWQNASGFH